MKILLHRVAFLALLLPILGTAAETARSEYARVLKAKPDELRGAQLFGQCVSCHGADGGGETDGSTPRLAGQRYSYLVRQMHDAVDGRRPALPALHSQRIAPLDYEQVRAVSDFLARAGWEVSSAVPASRDPHPAS